MTFRIADMYSAKLMDVPAWGISNDTCDPADYEKTITIKETLMKDHATSYSFLAKPNDIDFDRIMAECGTEMAIVVIDHEPSFVLVANATLNRFNVTSETKFCGEYLCDKWGRNDFSCDATSEAVSWKFLNKRYLPRMRTCRAIPVNRDKNYPAITVPQIRDQWARAIKHIDLYKFTVVL